MNRSDDPLLELICTALELMNQNFLRVPTNMNYFSEFYHQLRKLWDKGVPVGLGLGHLLLQAESGGVLQIVQLGEPGQTDAILARVQFQSVAASNVVLHIDHFHTGTMVHYEPSRGKVTQCIPRSSLL
ncbi:MAG: hypothetical protein ACRCZF_09080 [Gemmataceae bacterium]